VDEFPDLFRSSKGAKRRINGGDERDRGGKRKADDGHRAAGRCAPRPMTRERRGIKAPTDERVRSRIDGRLLNVPRR
jgi:hypothetical protein